MQRSAGRTHTVEMLVLQSTPFCNIDCDYCYLPSRAVKQRMSEATLARAFDRVFTSPFLGDTLTVLWHAGEPLVPGIAYYRRAFELLDARKPPGLSVKHNFQTNGMLLHAEWIAFLREYGASLGLSLDGPAHLHDRHRKTRAGAGTFTQAMRAVDLLREHAFPFHVITVLTRESLACADELFAFYLDNGITQVAFNIEEIEGGHDASSLQDAGTDAAARAFYRRFIELMEAHPGRIDLREFSGAFHGIADPASADYGNPLAEPLRMVSVGVNGELSTFSPELLGYGSDRHGAFVFGNVHEHSVAEMLEDARFLAVSGEIARGLERCRGSCEYFEICRGGAPANKWFETGSFETTETLFCRLTKKAVIDVVLERMEHSLGMAS